MSEVYEIERLAAGGDGIASTPDGPIYIPFALPGETWRRLADGTFEQAGPSSPMRVEPPCPHFGRCGGCLMQHLAPSHYEEWKRSLVDAAFRRQSLTLPAYEFQTCPDGSRRRLTLSAVATKHGTLLGFFEHRSHTIVDLEECVIARPDIVSQLPHLRTLARLVLDARPKRAFAPLRLTVAELKGALDVALTGAGITITAAIRSRCAELAALTKLQRISIDGDLILMRAEPCLITSGGHIVPPPGAFFQAVEAIEHAMAAMVSAGIGKAKRVADLFAGVGTFTLPLARAARVSAFDTERAALEALASAVRNASGLKPVVTVHRDLFREPLSLMELREFDAVVLDPPRAGARAQCEAIAKSGIGRVVMVSCNPDTMARDIRSLADGGFVINAFAAFDQFHWSDHIEAIAVLSRKSLPRR